MHPHAAANGFGGARRSGVFVSIAFTLMMPLAAHAQDRDTFDVQILAIRGTKSDTEIAPELKSMVDDLKRSTGCTGFKVVKKTGGSVPAKKAYKSGLVGGYEAEITPLERKDGRVTLQVEIVREAKGKEDKDKEKGRRGKDGVNTKVTISSGQFQPYMFAYPGEASDKLIVAVSAK